MILLYPVVLLAAAVVMRRAAGAERGTGWFAWWAAAGAVFTFSFVTGFTIGLFILPVAALLLFWVARRAPGAEAMGFAAGAGVVVGVLSPFAGAVVCSLALVGYFLLRAA